MKHKLLMYDNWILVIGIVIVFTQSVCNGFECYQYDKEKTKNMSPQKCDSSTCMLIFNATTRNVTLMKCYHTDWHLLANCGSTNCTGFIDKGRGFCCCTGNLCNHKKFIFVQVALPIKSPTRSLNTADKRSGLHTPSGRVSVTQTAAVVLLPLLAVSVFIILGYYLYRKCTIRPTNSQQYMRECDEMPLMYPPCGRDQTASHKHNSPHNAPGFFLPGQAPLAPGSMSDNSQYFIANEVAPFHFTNINSTDHVSPLAASGSPSIQETQIDSETCEGMKQVAAATKSHRLTQMEKKEAWWRPEALLVRGKMSCIQRCSLVAPDERVLRQGVIKTLCDYNLWRNEVDTYHVAGLKHNNIAEFITSEQPHPGVYWLVLGYHSMGSVHDYVEKNVLSWSQALDIICGVANGLHHLHEENAAGGKPPIAHRDIKSKNVLLNDNLQPCIADFGLALQLAHGVAVTSVQSQVGTRRYMSPEVLQGMIAYDRQSFLSVDIYSMALVLWEVMRRSHLPPLSSLPQMDRAKFEPAPHEPPYEAELAGMALTLSNMQHIVAGSHMRPQPRSEWMHFPGMRNVWRTIEECWDSDPEARLSAGCVFKRLRRIIDAESTITSSQGATSEEGGSECGDDESSAPCVTVKAKRIGEEKGSRGGMKKKSSLSSSSSSWSEPGPDGLPNPKEHDPLSTQLPLNQDQDLSVTRTEHDPQENPLPLGRQHTEDEDSAIESGTLGSSTEDQEAMTNSCTSSNNQAASPISTNRPIAANESQKLSATPTATALVLKEKLSATPTATALVLKEESSVSSPVLVGTPVGEQIEIVGSTEAEVKV